MSVHPLIRFATQLVSQELKKDGPIPLIYVAEIPEGIDCYSAPVVTAESKSLFLSTVAVVSSGTEVKNAAATVIPGVSDGKIRELPDTMTIEAELADGSYEAILRIEWDECGNFASLQRLSFHRLALKSSRRQPHLSPENPLRGANKELAMFLSSFNGTRRLIAYSEISGRFGYPESAYPSGN